MRSEVIQKLVGRPVRDVYGRYVGYVVGFSVDTTGELTSVGVDHGSGEFIEYPNTRIISDKDSLVVIPSWKIETDGLAKETETVRRRAKAADDLAAEGEIPKHLYDEMFNLYGGQLKTLQESYKALAEKIKNRLGEIENQSDVVDRFLANVKVQFRSGEIDESTFKVVSDYCSTMKGRNIKETEDLSRVLRLITEPLTQPASPETAETEPVPVQTVQGTTAN
jgi:hypothetical protein